MIRLSQKQEAQVASFEDTAAHLPEPFIAEAPGRRHGNRTGPIGDQAEKFRPPCSKAPLSSHRKSRHP